MRDYTVRRVVVGEMETNCYIIRNIQTGDACVIDPGGNLTLIQDAMHKMNARCRLILLTHGHFDHILAVGDLRSERIPVVIHENDAHCLTERDMFSKLIPHDPRPFAPAEYCLKREGQYTINDISFYMIPTPGHTKGSVCYLFEDHLFTGDTLFRNSIGTTDFGGDRDALNNSLRMLCRLPGDYTIYPGHESMTSLSEEIRNNPFIRSLRRN